MALTLGRWRPDGSAAPTARRGRQRALWTEGEDLRETEPVTSPEAGRCATKTGCRWRSAEESELQLTSATAIAAAKARRDQGSERMGSATQRMGLLTRLHTRDEGVKHPAVNNFLSLKDLSTLTKASHNCRQFGSFRPRLTFTARAPGPAAAARSAPRSGPRARSPSAVLVSLTSCCGAAVRAERQHHDAVLGELLDERLRDALRRRGDDDAVERRAHRHAVQAVADHDLDIAIAERREPPARASRPACGSARC